MKKLKFLLSGVLVLTMFFTGCGKSQQTGDKTNENVNKDELVMAIGTEPDEGFDPCTGWGRRKISLQPSWDGL